MRKTSIATGLGVAAVLGVALPASAASSGGAGHTETGCQDFGIYTVCWSGHDEYNVTTTPSGNQSVETNGVLTYSVAESGTTIYSHSSNFHVHFLFKNDSQQEQSQRLYDTVTSVLGTCTLAYDYHYANGQEQYVIDNYACQ